MNKYERSDPYNKNEKSIPHIKRNGRTAIERKSRQKIASFLKTDTNESIEKEYAKEEKKNTMTWIEDKNGNMIQVDIKELKKNAKKKKK